MGQQQSNYRDDMKADEVVDQTCIQGVPVPDKVLEEKKIQAEAAHNQYINSFLNSLIGLSEDAKKEKYEAEIRKLMNEAPPSSREALKVERTSLEKAEMDLTPYTDSITWDKYETIHDLSEDGLFQRTHKRVLRSKPDAWRRYGAFVKLHEVGGIATKLPGAHEKTEYFEVKAGSQVLIRPPDVPPLRTVEDYLPFNVAAPVAKKDD